MRFRTTANFGSPLRRVLEIHLDEAGDLTLCAHTSGLAVSENGADVAAYVVRLENSVTHRGQPEPERRVAVALTEAEYVGK